MWHTCATYPPTLARDPKSPYPIIVLLTLSTNVIDTITGAGTSDRRPLFDRIEIASQAPLGAEAGSSSPSRPDLRRVLAPSSQPLWVNVRPFLELVAADQRAFEVRACEVRAV